MSYLLAETTPDELLLLIATECGERPDPLPDNDDPNHWYGTLRGRPQRLGPGFIKLNNTDNLIQLWRDGYIYDHPRVYASVCLTWKGWDRLGELIAAGHTMPTEEEKSEYARAARLRVEGRDNGDYIPYDEQIPNPKGIKTNFGRDLGEKKTRWYNRLFQR